MPGIAEANRTLQVWAVRTLPREFDGTRKSEVDNFGSLDKFCTASLQARHVAIVYSRLWKRLSSSVTPSINRLESRRQPLLKNKKEEKEISCHVKLVRNLERSDYARLLCLYISKPCWISCPFLDGPCWITFSLDPSYEFIHRRII